MLAAVKEIVLSVGLVHLITAVLIPIGVGLLTKLRARNAVKVVVTMLLTAIGTLVTQHIAADGTAVLSLATLVTFVELFVLQLAVFFGVIKPTGVREVLAPNQGIE